MILVMITKPKDSVSIRLSKVDSIENALLCQISSMLSLSDLTIGQ